MIQAVLTDFQAAAEIELTATALLLLSQCYDRACYFPTKLISILLRHASSALVEHLIGVHLGWAFRPRTKRTIWIDCFMIDIILESVACHGCMG